LILFYLQKREASKYEYRIYDLWQKKSTSSFAKPEWGEEIGVHRDGMKGIYIRRHGTRVFKAVPIKLDESEEGSRRYTREGQKRPENTEPESQTVVGRSEEEL